MEKGLIGFIFIAVIGGLIWFSLWRSKKRREALGEAAQKIGFACLGKPPGDLLSSLKEFNLFKIGRYRNIKNVLQGQSADIGWLVFDYQYTIDSGEDSQTSNQTIACANLKDITLPKFSLSQEHIFHKIGQAFGYKDIDFSSYPAFSKQYLLRGPDEPKIRSVFTPAVLNFFEQQKNIFNVEAEASKIIIYRPRKRVKPEELLEFIEEAKRIVGLFLIKAQRITKE